MLTSENGEEELDEQIEEVLGESEYGPAWITVKIRCWLNMKVSNVLTLLIIIWYITETRLSCVDWYCFSRHFPCKYWRQKPA